MALFMLLLLRRSTPLSYVTFLTALLRVAAGSNLGQSCQSCLSAGLACPSAIRPGLVQFRRAECLICLLLQAQPLLDGQESALETCRVTGLCAVAGSIAS